jgi:lantibiotic modifying enzyme
MNLSTAETDAILSAAAENKESSSQPWAGEVRRMLVALEDYEFQPGRRPPLAKLCEAGARYGWKFLEAAGPDLRDVSPRAKASLRRDLRHSLAELTRPCLELERTSFGFAMDSIGVVAAPADSTSIERMFLRDKPSDRLFSLFKKFPVLARLWGQVIGQWRQQVTEVLVRLKADRRVLSQAFFDGRPLGKIKNVRGGLSDRHNSGRTVMRLQFDAGSVIYKPRSGLGEWEWFSLLSWMNENSFRPTLRAARVLPRRGYCWMEDIAAAPCKNDAAARRFFQRMGGMIAAAHLLKAVDCHRDNIIASGEYPILVDVDALWHVSPVTKTQSSSDVLYRTGFFPDSNRRGLQSRSSALGRGTTGNHRARLAGKPLEARLYTREIVTGFARAWRSILGTRNRRAAFARRLRRIRSQERRWIYWATETYANIRRASLQPAALRSGVERDLLITRLCTESRVTSAPIDAEVHSLKQLDIPYFIRRSDERMPPEERTVPLELVTAVRDALQF